MAEVLGTARIRFIFVPKVRLLNNLVEVEVILGLTGELVDL